MAKTKKSFLCTSCGAEHGQWNGRCPDCGVWNSIVEIDSPIHKKKKTQGQALPLSSIEVEKLQRFNTGLGELDLVCGGGVVPGSVVLIGGEPGIGKSTMALQIAHLQQSLYCSGEESPAQIRQRADRLAINLDPIKITTETDIDSIITLAHKEQPKFLFVDSIQTVSTSEIPGVAGSVSQIRESASRLVTYAKTHNVTVFIIGHITKDGSIAGPKLLEHLVDTVLYFEGETSRDYRMLRAFKNRFGSANEIGLFRMTAEGLKEVVNKHDIFLSPFESLAPGNAVSAAMEGSRSMLFEVQSLVTPTSFTNPRRMADGFDLNRLIIIIAILEKHSGILLNSFDVFINVSGGFQINETSADIAVAAAIASSLKDVAISKRIGFLGELSLSGELRPVSNSLRRIQEFKVAGYETLVISEGNEKDIKEAGFSGAVAAVKHVDEALKFIFQ